MAENTVDVKVREIRRRTASFQVATGKNTKITARINAKSMNVSSGYGTLEMPKTIEAINALSDLVDAMRQELYEQGVVPVDE